MNHKGLISLNNNEIELVSGGSRLRTVSHVNSISHDALYSGSLAGAVFFTGVLLVPGIGTAVALTAFAASLASSGLAINAGTK